MIVAFSLSKAAGLVAAASHNSNQHVDTIQWSAVKLQLSQLSSPHIILRIIVHVHQTKPNAQRIDAGISAGGAHTGPISQNGQT